ncbi:MAG: hypothetical protein AB7E81_07640 [Hyphomicrobiaceae bacterium]
MADRTSGKAKKQVKKAPGRTARGAGNVRPQQPVRAANLEAECARLGAELKAAQAEIQALKDQRKELLDRINWAIDSLTSLHDN